MLEILQYSMNAVFPILLLILLGYHAKKAGMLSEQTKPRSTVLTSSTAISA